MMVDLVAATVGPAVVVAQAGGGMAPLPADPPIGGPVWTIVVPALLLFGSFAATYLLYKRFAKEEGE